MTFEEFEILGQTYNVIPVSKSLLADTLTPVSAYLRLRKESDKSFLFESVEGGERIARYSFIGKNPIVTLKCKEKTTWISEKGITFESNNNFFDIIDKTISKYKQPTLPNLPRFRGGLVGFIGYDAIRFVENIPASVSDSSPMFDSILSLYTTVLAFDHLKHQIIIIVNVVVNPDEPLIEQYNSALNEIATLESQLRDSTPSSHEFHSDSNSLRHEIEHEQFLQSVEQAKHHIHEGDIFQVVLSQRFSTSYHGDLFNVYRALRIVNPSPYLYYLSFDDFTVIGSSPEILVRVENGATEVYPIAGTRRRGATDEEDKRLEAELLADTKERAEHIMLVDLGRNDLGRVCEVGTVKVDQLMFVVRYSHVMHIASRVTGKVDKEKSCVDVLKATFPAGTVSGAPKIRAMEIIDKLEKSRRGIYAGGVGYFDFSGNMDICIAIRTMFATNDTIYLQSGAGIVADSNPESEYRETINKAQALVEALKLAEGMMR
ncbi:MAG: anthranilate synthase component I [Ignavibacteriae bacterium]|nr:anthranilate synthase component I [Ignavibacteriota bacterium]